MYTYLEMPPRQRIINMVVNSKSKRIESLTISLVSNKNVQTLVDVSVEAAWSFCQSC